MMFFKNIRFIYYWTKGEKALMNGDEKTANVCKKETKRNQKSNKRLSVIYVGSFILG